VEKGVCLKINANPGTVTAFEATGWPRKNSDEFRVWCGASERRATEWPKTLGMLISAISKIVKKIRGEFPI
jgi:hypothetical protein